MLQHLEGFFVASVRSSWVEIWLYSFRAMSGEFRRRTYMGFAIMGGDLVVFFQSYELGI